MLTRRESLLGGLLTIAWVGGSCTCGAETLRVRQGHGCVLEPDEAEQVFARATQQQTYVTGREAIIASSGNRDFDYALAQTLSRLTDTMRVLPGFAYYDDVAGENAYATSARRLAKADGSVLFGKRYFLNLMSLPEHPDVAITATCAHEFGHIVQFKLKLMDRLNAGQSNVKRSELHADFLGGYFAGVRKRQKPDYPAAVFATDAYSSGDYNVGSRSHHGTPDERAAAIVRGFEVAHGERRSFSDAIQIGINYVSRL
jgi:predicted metalloprotease